MRGWPHCLQQCVPSALLWTTSSSVAEEHFGPINDAVFLFVEGLPRVVATGPLDSTRWIYIGDFGTRQGWRHLELLLVLRTKEITRKLLLMSITINDFHSCYWCHWTESRWDLSGRCRSDSHRLNCWLTVWKMLGMLWKACRCCLRIRGDQVADNATRYAVSVRGWSLLSSSGLDCWRRFSIPGLARRISTQSSAIYRAPSAWGDLVAPNFASVTHLATIKAVAAR